MAKWCGHCGGSIPPKKWIMCAYCCDMTKQTNKEKQSEKHKDS